MLGGQCPNCGASWEELRQSVTRELRDGAVRFTRSFGFEPTSSDTAHILMTGHQPEFFHPGVWIKNFVVSALARELGFAPLNVIVDNDSAKHTSVRVPALGGDKATTRSATLATGVSDLAYEEVGAEKLRAKEFVEELRETTRDGTTEAAAASTIRLLSEEAKRATDLVGLVVGVRCNLEREMGFGSLELPVSALSETDGFRKFAAHVLSTPWDFAECYNSALKRYRQENHVRGKRRPLPDLARSRDNAETPFWTWQRNSQRERLFVKRDGDRIRFADPISRDGNTGWDEGNCDEARAALASLAQRGWKVRPRALSMTAFLRSFGSTGFIHGIGGGKYDEITDSFLSEFFGLEPLPYWVVSATLLLPIPLKHVAPRAVTEQRRLLRDFRYNPQRHAGKKREDEKFRALVEKKSEWIRTDPAPGEEGRRRFEDIRRLNKEMLQVIQTDLRRERERLQKMEEDVRFDAIAGNREYSFILHPLNEVKEFFTEALSRMRGSSTDR